MQPEGGSFKSSPSDSNVQQSLGASGLACKAWHFLVVGFQTMAKVDVEGIYLAAFLVPLRLQC